MKADRAILQLTYSGVIESLSETGNMPLRDALDMFFKSQTYIEMRDGVSDMHCRSKKYLAEDIIRERPINEQKNKNCKTLQSS